MSGAQSEKGLLRKSRLQCKQPSHSDRTIRPILVLEMLVQKKMCCEVCSEPQRENHRAGPAMRNEGLPRRQLGREGAFGVDLEIMEEGHVEH